jgi:hypothetical protein
LCDSILSLMKLIGNNAASTSRGASKEAGGQILSEPDKPPRRKKESVLIDR